jgi:hypothetical protein
MDTARATLHVLVSGIAWIIIFTELFRTTW